MLLCIYLLAELLQVGDDAVTQAAVQGVCNKVGRAHHSHGLFQRLMAGRGTGKCRVNKVCEQQTGPLREAQQHELRLPGGSREASS